MTPERLAEIREEAEFYLKVGGEFMPEDVLELLAHIEAQDEQIAALRRGQGPAPAPREPGPITVTPVPDSRRTT